MRLLATNTVVSWEPITKPTFERLAQAAITNLKLPVDAITSIPAYHTLSQEDSESTSQEDPESTRAEEILIIVDCYLKLGLTSEAAQLLGTGLPDVPDATSGLWEQWKLLFSFLKDLVKLLSQYEDANLRDQAKPFIIQMLHTAAEYFARTRPKEPRSWAQDKSKDYKHERCSCGPCNALRLFLYSPKEQVGRFSYAQRVRSHLEYQLDRQDFKFDTDKSRSPHTLVVTKTRNKYHRDLDEWFKTIDGIRKEFEDFNVLLEPLGINATQTADLDAQLVTRGLLKGAMQRARPLQPASASSKKATAPKKAAGVKRKSDVVDLTED
jgi:hypothetical protein